MDTTTGTSHPGNVATLSAQHALLRQPPQSAPPPTGTAPAAGQDFFPKPPEHRLPQASSPFFLDMFHLPEGPCASEAEAATRIRNGLIVAAEAAQNPNVPVEATQAFVRALARLAAPSANARREFAQTAIVILRDPTYSSAHGTALFRNTLLGQVADLASRHDDCRRILLGIGPQALPTLLETAPETARTLAKTLCANAAPSWNHESICHYQEVVVEPAAGPRGAWSVLIMQNNKPPLALIGPHAGPLSTLETALRTGEDAASWQVLQTFKKISQHRRDLPTLLSTIRPPTV